MVIYDLSCTDGHKFEGWFKKPDDFGEQLESSLLSCPVCGSLGIKKLPTASHIKTGAVQESVSRSSKFLDDNTLTEAMQNLHIYIDKNFVDVGDQFTEEARKMHYGESENKRIRGTATPEDVHALAEEGIDTLPLPGISVDKNKLI